MRNVTQDFTVSADGVRIGYETRGSGTPAVILVHGWSCDRSYWAGQIEPLSRRFQLVTIDLAGHGESGAERAEWTMPSFGADVAAVVEKLGLDRAILVGHSMGGEAILEAARRLPGRVAGLVWVDVYNQLGTPGTPEQLQASMAPFRTDFVESTRAFVRRLFLPDSDPALVERVAMDMSAAPLAVALGSLASAWSFDHEIPRLLSELDLPLVAINAGYRPTDVASLERLGIEVVLMPDVAHFPMMEDPERFNQILAGVLDQLAG